MHLAGQSFMAEARTRKNVCFNFGAPVTLPHPLPCNIAAPPDHIRIRLPALNYSECEKIRKIRSFALFCSPLSFSLYLFLPLFRFLTILSRLKSWLERHERTFLALPRKCVDGLIDESKLTRGHSRHETGVASS